ncbi:replicative DNA helicase [Aestuariivirga litoralis]|uniref:replicative DNA helicase n=1 Tax=Aestuariivirga litoralis TaxID=2650924 RepID=UPI0018C538DE|nr:replicative DNA helicase [Aestuariivirga litoralis]MBG1232110.1 replicative DNA helicase [Aestuariivirga litoralis]
MSMPSLRAVDAPADETSRIPPQNLEAEQALLGAILSNNEAADRVTSFLGPEHFSEAVHARIYEAATTLIRMGKLASPVTLKTHFENDQSLKEIGGAVYLARLAANATTIINADEYGRAIFELAQRRKLISLGTDVVNESFQPDIETSVRDIIEKTEQALYGLAEKEQFGKGFERFGASLAKAIDMASAAYQRDGHLSGISCGLSDMDEKMGGLQKSDLIILAARPAMGKSALASNIAYHVAKAYKSEYQPDGSQKVLDGGVVAFFSLEMSTEQLATRIISEQAGIPSEDIRRGKITEDQFQRLVDISRELQALPLYLDDTGGLSIAQVAARARRLKRQRGLGLVVVDYLQLLAGSAKKAAEGRVQEVTEITVGLKALAKELNVPIIALSQLSRQVENREDKRPQLADLRESGSIEQDADVVLFIYREDYYLQRLEPHVGTPEHQDWQEKMDRAHGKAEVIIGKQRHGPTGTIELQFEGKFTRFSNLAREDHLPERFG